MKSNFTPDNKAKILARLEAGLTMDDAALATDQSPKTVNGWLDRGRKEPDTDYGTFVQDVIEARAKASDRPPPMDEKELISVVSGMARAGSVQGAKLLYDILRDGKKPSDKSRDKPQSNALAEIDELAVRRRNP